MRSTFSFHLLCATLLAGRTRAVAVETCSTNPHDGWSVGKAVYLQSNKDLNSIISIPIGHDGKLYGGLLLLPVVLEATVSMVPPICLPLRMHFHPKGQ